MFRLNKNNIAPIKNKSGVYRIYSDDYKRPVYIGTSKILRHHLQSYYQKDDWSVNRTKRRLRPHADKFTFSYLPIRKARQIEKREKHRYRFNIG